MGPYRDWFVATRALQLHPVIGRACPWVHVGIGLLLPALASGFLAVSFLLLLTSFSVPSKQAAKQLLSGSFSEQSEIVCFHFSFYVLGVIIFATIVTP